MANKDKQGNEFGGKQKSFAFTFAFNINQSSFLFVFHDTILYCMAY